MRSTTSKSGTCGSYLFSRHEKLVVARLSQQSQMQRRDSLGDLARDAGSKLFAYSYGDIRTAFVAMIEEPRWNLQEIGERRVYVGCVKRFSVRSSQYTFQYAHLEIPQARVDLPWQQTEAHSSTPSLSQVLVTMR